MAPCESLSNSLLAQHEQDATDMEVVLDQEAADVKHPCPQFMERAIVLSRVAGLEKRTGAFIAANKAHIQVCVLLKAII